MNMKNNIFPLSGSVHALSGKTALQVMHGARDGIVVIDEQNRIVFFNAMAEELWGYARSDVIGQNVDMLLPAGMRDGHDAFIGRNRDTGINTIIGTSREITFENRAGEYIKGKLALSMIAVRPDNRKYYLATVSASREEDHGRSLLDLQNTIFRALSTDMMIRDVAGLVCREIETFVPDTIAALMVVGDDRHLQLLSGVGVPRRYASALGGIVLSDTDNATFMHDPAEAGNVVWKRSSSLGLSLGLHHCHASAILSPGGKVAGILALFSRDYHQVSDRPAQIVRECVPLCGVVIEQYEARQRIAQLNRYDPLTGFLNRQALYESLEKLIARPGDNRFAVLVLDIDRFRDINEALGHKGGDLLLQAAASRMRVSARGDHILSRSGGDTFILVLPEAGQDEAIRFVDSLRQELAQPVAISGNDIVPSFRVGVSLFPDTGSDGEALIGRAETAMRQVRADTPGTCQVAPPEDHAAAQSSLPAILARDLLTLHYQPQVMVQSGRLYGVEAHARWRHPHLGDIFPSRFVAMAEDTGQIEAIGTWLLEDTCRQLVEWERDGIHVPAVTVNLSAGYLRRRNLPEMVAMLLKSHQLAPDRLTVAVNESVMMDENPETAAVLYAIRNLGVGLSMDDFGTGSSSLSRLTRLPLTEIRIDRSFVTQLEHDANARALTVAVSGMAGMLGMKVVAKGVETETQKALLEQLHCDVLQGLAFSPALAPCALGHWAANRKIM